jgi:DNA-binding transcriptional regulator YhcF (GntR family)
MIFGEPGDTRKWVTYANQITARIADGTYPPGEWLPPLAKISADLGAVNSYTPIRTALKEIRAQKLISFAENTGYYTGNTEPEQKPQQELGHYAAPRTPATAPGDRILVTAQVAAMFHVNTKTVTRWANTGKLTSFRTLGGDRRYYATEAEKLLRDSTRKRQKG